MTISVIPAIKSLKIRNMGLIKRDLKFTKGINIICGASGCGKSQIIDILIHMFKGGDITYCTDTNKKHPHKGRIEVELLRKKVWMEVEELIVNPERPKGAFSKKDLSVGGRIMSEVTEAIRIAGKERAVLLDDLFGRLDREKRKFVWGLLKKSKLQVITTAHSKDEMTEKANMIELPSIRNP